ncbi:MAG: hypothetical protein AAB590_00660 [Patescibacteria group bacterium]
MGDRGEPGNAYAALLRLAHGAEDLNALLDGSWGNDTDIPRCGASDGEGNLCPLAADHKKDQHSFQDVATIAGVPCFTWYCPYCGACPLVEGPGCRKCDADAAEEEI